MKKITLNNYSYIFIIGATGCGKSTITKKLIQTNNMVIEKKYTTRPRRETEINDKISEYDFISSEEMKSLNNSGLILSHIAPKTAHGVWEYGIPVFKQYNKFLHRTRVQVFGIDHISNIIATHGDHWIPKKSLFINIFIDKNSLLSKLNVRNDNNESIRRVSHDIDLFGEYPDTYHKVYNQISNIQKTAKFSLIDILNHGYTMSVDDILYHLNNFSPDTLNTSSILGNEGFVYMYPHDYGWDVVP